MVARLMRRDARCRDASVATSGIMAVTRDAMRTVAMENECSGATDGEDQQSL